MHGCHGLNHIDTWAFHTLSIRRELYLVVVPHLALVLLSLPLFLLEDQRWQLEEVDLRTDRLGIVCCTFLSVTEVAHRNDYILPWCLPEPQT